MGLTSIEIPSDCHIILTNIYRSYNVFNIIFNQMKHLEEYFLSFLALHYGTKSFESEETDLH